MKLKSTFILLAMLFSMNAPAASIKVLTLNMWGLPLGISKFKAERFDGFCDYLKNDLKSNPEPWDVIVFEEAWLLKNQSMLTQCGYPYSFRPDHKSLNRGLMMISRFPFVKRYATYYPKIKFTAANAKTGEYMVHKGAIAAVVDHPQAGKVLIAGTHLVANYGGNLTFDNTRRYQLKLLKSWIDRIKGDLPVIVAGDLNVAPYKQSDQDVWPLVESLFAGYHHADMPSDTCTYCPPNTFAGNSNEGKIDHLFSNEKLIPVSAKVAMTTPIPTFSGPMYVSDHFGFETVFETATENKTQE